MECPNCRDTTNIQSFNGEGYSEITYECLRCGCYWEEVKKKIVKEGRVLLRE